MLKRNHIPNKEPVVTIGIIMPEDKAKTITVKTPHLASDKYNIKINNVDYQLEGDSDIFFNLKNGITEVRFNNIVKSSGDKISISPLSYREELKPKSGLKVKNVISGRDFHWKKHIDVYLPDTIVISIFDNSLFLYNELLLEHYLMCVATSEMNAACPDSLIQSQTVVARSWILAAVEQKHKDLGIDSCNDDCCQRYQGTTNLSEQSVKGSSETKGLAVLYDNKICDTRYSKSCGGMTESFDTIWEEKTIPYLKVFPDYSEKQKGFSFPLTEENNFKKWVKAVPDAFCSSDSVNEEDLIQYLGSVDEGSKYYRWQRYVSQEDLTENLNKHHKINAESVKKLEVSERGGSGRIKYLEVTYSDKNGNDKKLTLNKDFIIRQSLDKSFLYSSAFIVEAQYDTGDVPKGFLFTGAGWGHGVGYCQIGALGMALKKYTNEEILKHYFPGSELKKIY